MFSFSKNIAEDCDSYLLLVLSAVAACKEAGGGLSASSASSATACSPPNERYTLASELRFRHANSGSIGCT